MAFGADTVRAALEIALASATPAIQTVFENTVYTAVDGVPYQQCNILFADPLNIEMHDRYFEQGYMQVMLQFPSGNGAGTIEQAAMLLRNYFHKGLSIAFNGATVTIIRTPTIGNGVIDANRFAVPVKIRFMAQPT